MTPRKETIGDAELWLGAAERERVASEHYNWRGDNVSEKGGRKRALRLYPDIGPCSKCGAAKAERHHRDDNTANNDPSNIAILCRRCHMDEDGRLEIARKTAAARLPQAVKAAAAEKLSRTHCKRGHLLSGDNLFRTSAGARGCKACRKIHKATYRSAHVS